MIEILPQKWKDKNNLHTLEWLIANGLGGFASGTVSQVITRRYHGYFLPAVSPPAERRLLVAKMEEEVRCGLNSTRLFCNQWANDRILDCPGLDYLYRFVQEKDQCSWEYAIFDGILRKSIFMAAGENRVGISYQWSGSEWIDVQAKILVNNRDMHGHTEPGEFAVDIQQKEKTISVHYSNSPDCLSIESSGGEFVENTEWYEDYFWHIENNRGLDNTDAHLHFGDLRFTLAADDELVVWISLDEFGSSNKSIPVFPVRETNKHRTTAFRKVLVDAAEQFIVQRQVDTIADGRTIIAGYHWFTDWGRDTMISLPGLTLATGKFDVAEKIIRTFIQYVDQGMIPNRFPDIGETPEYNTVDATLWLFVSVDQYLDHVEETSLLKEIYPVLESIIDWHIRGTRYHIKMDQADGLLFAGEEGVQLTWMDAKVNDWVVTPRIGKPVEVNALWYRAICCMERFSRLVGKNTNLYSDLAAKIRTGINKFWDHSLGYCYDVLDGPDGNDPALRPNQLFLVSLADNLLEMEQRKAIVDICRDKLLTPVGLRSLSPDDSRYIGRYGGDIKERDGAYHQGTVWAWLIGPYLSAHWKVYSDRDYVRKVIFGFEAELMRHGIGTISEIYDGDPPHHPRGAISQAWSIAELLRLMDEIRID